MPAGTSPAAAVSPEGRPAARGTGALKLDILNQSCVRVTATVLSDDAERSLERDGKHRLVMVDSWCESVPISRFAGVPAAATGSGRSDGWLADVGRGGATAVMWYRFTRASVLPVASMRREGADAVVADAGERARHRIAEAWALKRKLSVKRTSVEVALADGIDTTNPCRTRS